MQGGHRVGAGRRGAPGARRGRNQPPQQRRHVGRTAPQRGRVERHRHDGRLAGGAGRVEQCHAVRRGQRCHAGAHQPADVGLGQFAGQAGALRPRPPGQRGPGQAVRGAVLGERVEEGVGRRVVALPCSAEHARRRGEQDERVQLHALGQQVQVPGAAQLGGEYGVEALRCHGGEDAVVEDGGGVHDRAQRMRVGYLPEGVRQGVAVGRVAGHHSRFGTQFGQLRHEFGSTGCGRAAPAGQQQVPHAMCGHQVLGELGAQGAGRTGDQYGAVAAQDGVLPPGRVRHGHPGEARGVGPAGPQGELRLSGPVPCLSRRPGPGLDGVRDGRQGPYVVVDVKQQQPGVLRLRRAQQAPHRCGRQVDRLVASDGHRVAGHHHQPGGGEPLVGQPALDQFERPVHGVLCRRYERVVVDRSRGSREALRDHHVGHLRALGERGVDGHRFPVVRRQHRGQPPRVRTEQRQAAGCCGGRQVEGGAPVDAEQ